LYVVSKARLAKEVHKLQHENADLRERLAAAHHVKQQAEYQAEELRSQKERLRMKTKELKTEVTTQRRLLDQAHANNGALREDLEALKADRHCE
jgi:chromosome segregation ATPase